MDRAWIGRKLGVASAALGARFAYEWEQQTGSRPALGAVAGSLIRELGRWLALDETDPSLPLSRCSGVLRVPSESRPAMLEAELEDLARLVRHHVSELPGADRDIDARLRTFFRHAVHAVAYLHRSALLGVTRPRSRRLFGGLAVVRYPRRSTARWPSRDWRMPG